MDDHLSELLKAVFEMGYNRGLGYMADPFVIEVEWSEVRLQLEAVPGMDRARLVKGQ